jgi:hypothetical protein
VNDSRQIAAQALKALQLRRQMERGDLTQQEYLDRLNGLQGTSAQPAGTPRPAPEPRQPTVQPSQPAAGFSPAAATPRRETATAKTPPATVEPPKVAPALEALRLRRRLDEGKLARPEYLSLLQAQPEAPPPPAPKPAPVPAATPRREITTAKTSPATVEPPKAAPALEALQQRRRPDEGDLARPEYLSLLQAQPEAPAPPAPKPAPVPAVVHLPPIRTRQIEIVTSKPLPERFLMMKCPRCGAALQIYDRTTDLQCGDCSAEIAVTRRNLTISLRLAGESSAEADPAAITPIAAKTGEELQKLTAEAAKVTNVKRAAGLLGGLCTAIFGYTGVTDLTTGHTGTGAFILFCGSVLIATVVCITLHTTRVKARLAERIRAINADEEFA